MDRTHNVLRLWLHRVEALVLLGAHFPAEHVLLLHVLHGLLHALATLEVSVTTFETLTNVQGRRPKTVSVLAFCG
jgi:hypothetical protein